ncbi:MAG: pyridoxamine 5'-phosphate oxidase family protein [Anaerolineae bacterium]|nr:pyridoxamine 5'-phosphate oxidase family protein [Anaerolineae bacterium]
MDMKVDRPYFPDGYGIPDHQEELLSWQYITERMGISENYWIITASPAGFPAASPIWGVWLENTLYGDGSPDTRRGRNIQANPNVVVHLEDGLHAVILEGRAEILQTAPERNLAERISAGYQAKYAHLGYAPTPEAWDGGGLFIFRPHKVMAWTKFPEDVTRWNLNQ